MASFYVVGSPRAKPRPIQRSQRSTDRDLPRSFGPLFDDISRFPPGHLKSTTWIRDHRAALLHHNCDTKPNAQQYLYLGAANQMPAAPPLSPKSQLEVCAVWMLDFEPATVAPNGWPPCEEHDRFRLPLVQQNFQRSDSSVGSGWVRPFHFLQSVGLSSQASVRSKTPRLFSSPEWGKFSMLT